jgi:hypothetical protein
MTFNRIAATLGLIGLVLPAASGSESAINLAGKWRFELDRANAGLGARWFTRNLPGSISLPGTLPGQGIGDPVTLATKWTGGIVDRSYFTAPQYAKYREPDNIKVPFWLQPDTYYVGFAWFQRDVVIPRGWAKQHVVLTLERPHWKTSVWLDQTECGSNDSLSIAHVYDLSALATPGHHVLTIRVDNTLVPDVGENSHSVSDHTQGNWNGIVGRVELSKTGPVWIGDLQIYPNASRRLVVVRGLVLAATGAALPATVRIEGGPVGGKLQDAVKTPVERDGSFSVEYSLGPGAQLWDEFTPALNHLTASINNGERRDATFGLRDLSASGHDLEINGRRLFLRGTLECAANPRTGSPPMDLGSWRRFYRIVKEHGLNHVRFHSWCPPEAAFSAADELGVYLQVEMASWPNQSTTLGDGRPVDAWLDSETYRILQAYGNHPSFAFVSACNEPGGNAVAPWLSRWISRHRTGDNRRLFTSGSGWPELPENDYNVRPEPRIQHWGEGLESRINSLPPETRTDYRTIIGAYHAPVVSHEIGQWCAYPDFSEMVKYTGYLKPRNFEIFKESLAAHHMSGQASDFLHASGMLQVLSYKEDIESALRTPDMGGFQLLGLSDFPGQGTALVGVLNAFWEEKGYVSPHEFRRFCASTVPLARLDRRVFTTADSLTADVEVANFGPAPIAGANTSWKLVGDDRQIRQSGRFAAREIPVGSGIQLGRIDLALQGMPSPARYKLVVSIEGTPFCNDWDIWVYPPPSSASVEVPAGVIVTHKLDADSRAKLEAGAAVVLMLPPGMVRPDPTRGKIALGFSSIFWNTAWTQGQAPHTLGILCDPKSAALATFPTDAYSNWQWWYPIRNAAAMILDAQPPELQPIVQVIDDWVTNRKLALVFEARVGRGRLLVTSVDLEGTNLDPVRLQLRSSLLHYAGGSAFHPKVSLSAEQILSLTNPETLVTP